MCPPVVFAPFALGQHGVRDSQKDGQHCGWNGGVDHVHLASFTGWEMRDVEIFQEGTKDKWEQPG